MAAVKIQNVYNTWLFSTVSMQIDENLYYLKPCGDFLDRSTFTNARGRV